MSESALRDLKNKKIQLKKSLTRFSTYSSTLSKSTNIVELKRRFNVAEQYLSQFENIQNQIELLEESDMFDQEREEFESNYFQIISVAEKFLLDNQSTSQTKIQDQSEIHQCSNNGLKNLRLPTIELPSFSGAYDEWFPYHDTFHSLIHTNENLNDIQKFHYLKSSIQGEASNVISALEITSGNYNEAWEMLKERYNNKRLIIQKHVRAIFELPTAHKENCSILRQILDGTSKHLRALKALQRSTEAWDDLLIHLISTKIDHTTNKEWENSITKSEIPSFKQMKDFLLHKCETLEIISNGLFHSPQRKPPSKPTLSHTVTQKQPCAFCQGSHLIYHCKDFLKLSVEKRLEESKNRDLCVNCLKHGHKLNKCMSGPCKKCGKRHNTLLHFPTRKEPDSQDVSSNGSGFLSTISTHVSENVSHILLSTAIVNIHDNQNKGHRCRILLDSGSQSNFITKELANKLKLELHPANIPVIGINRVKSQVTHCVNANISSTYNGFRAHIKCLVLQNIAENIPQVSVEKSKITIPKSITLADPNFNVSSKIDMLIGAEIFWSLMCVGQIKTSINQPYLQKTQLGWIISGKITNNHQRHTNTFCNLSLQTNLESSLVKFWEIEEVTQRKPLTLEEKECEEHFSKTYKRDEIGRFIVQLPLKADTIALGDSRQGAIKRLYSLERKLTKHPQLKADYDNFLHEYLDLNHMVKITNKINNVAEEVNYYLPHHAVVKEDSLTTRLRVVFDGSAKTSNGKSLNDNLMVGPNLQKDLFSILLRFRTYRYVMTADIEKMYRQILLDKSQTKLQRILWRFDPSKVIEEYELLTVTYGTASASYLAIKAMQQLALEEVELYPTGSSIVLRDFYVDDLLTGANTISEAKTIINELRELLSKGGFNLRKWSSNCKELLHIIPNSSKDSTCLNLSKDNVKTLGLQWNADSDVLQYQLKLTGTASKITKRSILSKTSQLFDPLGLLSPVIITAKIIMQRLWLLNITWDESVPTEIYSDWKKFEKQLEYLKNIIIPRQVTDITNDTNLEICGFCDASERAYGACVYIRSTGANGIISSRLLCSKSRVAPTKCISLPRLELCGAVLLSRLIEKVTSSLNTSIKNVRLWTDSTIVFFWIKSPSRKWKTFVSNRVSEIQTLTKEKDWNHVRTNENPADLLSRGTTLEQLSRSNLWWQGPDWLSMPEEHFPTNVLDLQQINENQLETRNNPDTLTFLIHEDLNIFNRYSDLNKLTRIIAYCMRFRRNISAKIKEFQEGILTGALTLQELDHANKILIRIVQQEAFAKELHCLRKKQSVPHGSRILCLNPFIDNEEIIRVGGRIQNSSLSYDKKHQIVLPGNHIFTRLLIEREHRRLLHAGVQQTTASLHSKYWPLSARGTVRNVIRKCIPCFKAKPKAEDYIMGNLPRARIEPARPFLNTGVDYCGPFHIREGRRRNSRVMKVYAAMFVCFATKATHIEIVSSLSSEAFISTLKRFVARRGHPAHMYSDNGTNFVGANRELQRLRNLFEDSEQERILNSLSQRNITWHFIPARAPHFGGLWEAAIKSAKYHLHRIMGNAHLSFEELCTLFTQIEAVLNSRPLIPMSKDPNDPTFLTPAHFLIGDSLTDIMEPNLTALKLNRLSRWQHVQRLKQHFWSRWSKEYLNQLQIRSKWKKQSDSSLQPGKLVLVKEDGSSPHQWISGRVLSIHRGTDGVTRAATIKTATGTTKRAANKLCVLPIDDGV